LNLFYSGKLQAMPASYRTDDGRFEVIRPLIECGEAEIAAFAAEMPFPIIPCNLCGSQDGLKRDAMTALLAELERTNPHVRAIMANALRNVRPTHLLDRDLARAWAERAPDVRPTTLPAPRPRHAAAQPVAAGGPRDGKLRLPVVD
jgi:tRNA 2-thiocytidine biosynthesis protein TtcA